MPLTGSSYIYIANFVIFLCTVFLDLSDGKRSMFLNTENLYIAINTADSLLFRDFLGNANETLSRALGRIPTMQKLDSQALCLRVGSIHLL